MWQYKDVTRRDFEIRKDFVEKVLIEYGASKIILETPRLVSDYGQGIFEIIFSDRIVLEIKGNYYRVDEVLFPQKPFIVIEYADNLENVKNNTMEDLDPFPYDLEDHNIIGEIQKIMNRSSEIS